MSRGLKIFLATFFLSLPFWWGINLIGKDLEDFFFFLKISTDPYLLAIKQNQKKMPGIGEIIPIRNSRVEDLNIEAKTAISVFFDQNGREKVLFQKNGQTRVPIASLSKLITALVVVENYDLSQNLEISKEAVNQEGDFGHLKIGERFSVKSLLYPLLMESSNDAAYALAELRGLEWFIGAINVKAIELNLENSYFANPTGVDPDKPEEPMSYSTGQDITRLVEYLLKKPLIWEILSAPKFDLFSPEGIFHHQLSNTNEFLEQRHVSWGSKILGGKTGWTPEAGGCLVLVLKSPEPNEYIINVILGAKDRFGEMEKMVDWIYKAYDWRRID